MIDRQVARMLVLQIISGFFFGLVYSPHGLIDSGRNVRTNITKSALLPIIDATFQERSNCGSCKYCHISEMWGGCNPCSASCSDPLRYQACREATAVNTAFPEGFIPTVWSVIPPFRSGGVLCPCAHSQSRETEARLSWLSSTEHRKRTGK